MRSDSCSPGSVAALAATDLPEACTEFGTVNSRFGGRPYRYTDAATSEPGWFLFNGLVKHDTVTGREERYQFEPGVFCSEVGVAPRQRREPRPDRARSAPRADREWHP